MLIFGYCKDVYIYIHIISYTCFTYYPELSCCRREYNHPLMLMFDSGSQFISFGDLDGKFHPP